MQATIVVSDIVKIRVVDQKYLREAVAALLY